jgi:hypothetical protein
MKMRQHRNVSCNDGGRTGRDILFERKFRVTRVTIRVVTFQDRNESDSISLLLNTPLHASSSFTPFAECICTAYKYKAI